MALGMLWYGSPSSHILKGDCRFRDLVAAALKARHHHSCILTILVSQCASRLLIRMGSYRAGGAFQLPLRKVELLEVLRFGVSGLGLEGIPQNKPKRR